MLMMSGRISRDGVTVVDLKFRSYHLRSEDVGRYCAGDVVWFILDVTRRPIIREHRVGRLAVSIQS